MGLVPRAADFPVYQERGGATRSKFGKKHPGFLANHGSKPVISAAFDDRGTESDPLTN
jgi:hypothetical protein